MHGDEIPVPTDVAGTPKFAANWLKSSRFTRPSYVNSPWGQRVGRAEAGGQAVEVARVHRAVQVRVAVARVPDEDGRAVHLLPGEPCASTRRASSASNRSMMSSSMGGPSSRRNNSLAAAMSPSFASLSKAATTSRKSWGETAWSSVARSKATRRACGFPRAKRLPATNRPPAPRPFEPVVDGHELTNRYSSETDALFPTPA